MQCSELEIEGPPEQVTYRCGECKKNVLTLWAPGNRGLIRGDYCLLGNVIFHNACADKYLEEFNDCKNGNASA